MTQAEWYIQKYGGGWRKARVTHVCDGMLTTQCGTLKCKITIDNGSKYLDTNVLKYPNPQVGAIQSSRTKRKLCSTCAEREMHKV